MAKITKPRKGTRSAASSPPTVESEVVADIDAEELESAKRDPAVKEFARYADETLRSLRRRGRSD